MQERLSGNPDARPVAPGSPWELVLDTNVLMDLWLFGNPGVAPLRAALESGRVRWMASDAMLTELAHVRARPLATRHAPAAAWHCPPAHLSPEPPAPAPLRCPDRSDQKFLDLAWHLKAPLWTRDRHLLDLRRKAARLGLAIETPEEGQLRLDPLAQAAK